MDTVYPIDGDTDMDAGMVVLVILFFFLFLSPTNLALSNKLSLMIGPTLNSIRIILVE